MKLKNYLGVESKCKYISVQISNVEGKGLQKSQDGQSLARKVACRKEGTARRAVGRRFAPTYAIKCQWLGLAATTFRHAFFIGRVDVVCCRRTYVVHMSVEKPGRAVAWPA